MSKKNKLEEFLKGDRVCFTSGGKFQSELYGVVEKRILYFSTFVMKMSNGSNHTANSECMVLISRREVELSQRAKA